MTVTFSDWITELANWVFLLIGAPTVAAAFFVVTAKNVVRAVLALVVTLAGTAALFLMLGAEFVGWTVVLVYIGAVVVLFLMGIMITQSPLTKSTDLSQPMSMRAPAVLLSIILFGVIAWAVIVSFGAEAVPTMGWLGLALGAAGAGQVAAFFHIGRPLYAFRAVLGQAERARSEARGS